MKLSVTIGLSDPSCARTWNACTTGAPTAAANASELAPTASPLLLLALAPAATASVSVKGSAAEVNGAWMSRSATGDASVIVVPSATPARPVSTTLQVCTGDAETMKLNCTGPLDAPFCATIANSRSSGAP